jgi:predicted esterase
MRSLLVPTQTHGRVLIADPAIAPASGTLIGFHGYGQSADTMLDDLRKIPGSESWRLVSVQALHRFYTRGDQAVVANWMTRQDRDAAIADNIEYVNRAVDAAVGEDAGAIVYLGFSQGASMAARIAANGRRPAAGLILLGGDIPPDVKTDVVSRFPPVLIGIGSRDTWYQPRAEEDLKFLEDHRIPKTTVRYDGAHEFTDEFRRAASNWIAQFARSRGED